MRRPLLAITVLSALVVTACGGSSSEPDAGPGSDPATSELDVDDAEPDAAGQGDAVTDGTETDGVDADRADADRADADGSVGEGSARWTMAGQQYRPDVVGCVTTIGSDGTIVEVVAQGALADGSSYAGLRLVDSPPSIGDASLQIEFPVDGLSYAAAPEPGGTGSGEVDDLFWEVVDGTFVLLGSFPVDGADVSIDLETPCDVIDLAGGGADGGGTDGGDEDGDSTVDDADAGDDAGGSNDGAGAVPTPGPGDAVGTLTGPDLDIVVVGTCTFDASDLTSADIAFADVRGVSADGTDWSVRFGISGSADRNTQLNVNGSEVVVRWPEPGALSQSTSDGRYELDDLTGWLTAEAMTDAGTYELDVSCFER